MDNTISYNAYFHLRRLHHFVHTASADDLAAVWYKVSGFPGSMDPQLLPFVNRFVEGIDDLSAFICQAYKSGELLVIGDDGEPVAYGGGTTGALDRTITVVTGVDADNQPCPADGVHILKGNLLRCAILRATHLNPSVKRLVWNSKHKMKEGSGMSEEQIKKMLDEKFDDFCCGCAHKKSHDTAIFVINIVNGFLTGVLVLFLIEVVKRLQLP